LNSNTSSTPDAFESVAALESFLSRPTQEVVQALKRLDGAIMILGAGGKMGPTLAMLAQRAVREGGLNQRVIAVSRFTDRGAAGKLRHAGVETIACDLMDQQAVQELPDAPNIIYMVGTKFGSTGQEAQTWATNAFLPGTIVPRLSRSRIVLFSSGNVYPLAPAVYGGCTEQTPPAPIGEYAQSVLGRERIFEHFCRKHDVPGVLFRLNYAVELRYGVLLDIARQVWIGEPIDLSMGHVNVVWQGDANAYALRALELAECPPHVLNVTGPETLSVRMLALQFGELLHRSPSFVGKEGAEALLSNAQEVHKLLGYPRVPLGRAIEWVAAWTASGGEVLGKPTKFQVRDGRF
jgi:nucleoside-diphosphate-sugar epimerase